MMSEGRATILLQLWLIYVYSLRYHRCHTTQPALKMVFFVNEFETVNWLRNKMNRNDSYDFNRFKRNEILLQLEPLYEDYHDIQFDFIWFYFILNEIIQVIHQNICLFQYPDGMFSRLLNIFFYVFQCYWLNWLISLWFWRQHETTSTFQSKSIFPKICNDHIDSIERIQNAGRRQDKRQDKVEKWYCKQYRTGEIEWDQ